MGIFFTRRRSFFLEKESVLPGGGEPRRVSGEDGAPILIELCEHLRLVRHAAVEPRLPMKRRDQLHPWLEARPPVTRERQQPSRGEVAGERPRPRARAVPQIDEVEEEALGVYSRRAQR